REQLMAEVAAQLGVLRSVQMLMPPEYYRRLWPQVISPQALSLAAAELQVPLTTQALLAALEEKARVPGWKTLSDWLDEEPEQANRMPWQTEITQQISQSCGLFCSYPDHQQGALAAPGAFYRFWRSIISQDAGLAILMDAPQLQQWFNRLPERPEAVIHSVYEQLHSLTAMDEARFGLYCQALLLDINGWAAVFARAQASYPGGEAPALGCLGDLLAVRMAWDWALLHWLQQHPRLRSLASRFAQQFGQVAQWQASLNEQQRPLWVWQRALEISLQADLARKLCAPKPAAIAAKALAVQAVFCIDVRSEPMRRALESVAPGIQTLGFAGFFGLPMEYQPYASDLRRPQLPALLTPALSARPLLADRQQRRLLAPLLRQHSQLHTGQQAAATFGWVEAKGVFEGLRLLAQSFGRGHLANPLNHFEGISGWQLWRDGAPLSLEATAQLLAGVLRHMGLTDGFAPRVLLVAHASCTANNPLAASLDCGACGGQSGEVNVRVLAYLLNQPDVRAALTSTGITIPAQSRFIPCLHNTTTDDLHWFGGDADVEPEAWHGWLKTAAERARALRAGSLDIKATSPERRAAAFAARSRDWAELRPEWGLANNAAFIVAPRAATAHVDLQGRAFLHDYHWQRDSEFATLELIITAPMVVTQWINLQYYASTTDNLHYGSGNKLLHNVVGGNLGVFEGNGGDLRIGLPLQSLHDGEHWRHQPVRLSVYLAAPRPAIAAIIERHPNIADLINQDWLYLFQWDTEQLSIQRYYRGQWQPAPNTQQLKASPCTP
ncbi:MAG TPA: Na-translocating system protein MpsB, partial [Marinagarivorans sp.]|nr:Na-translocating system protein MpsB [Marinagarivorans sp.]